MIANSDPEEEKEKKTKPRKSCHEVSPDITNVCRTAGGDSDANNDEDNQMDIEDEISTYVEDSSDEDIDSSWFKTKPVVELFANANVQSKPNCTSPLSRKQSPGPTSPPPGNEEILKVEAYRAQNDEADLQPDPVPSSAMNNDGPTLVKLEIGSYCLVKRGENQWYRAEVIECRRLSKPNVERQPLRDITSDRAESDSSDQGFEYYVHYENCDRRLDEWVHPSRISRTNDTSSCQGNRPSCSNAAANLHPGTSGIKVRNTTMTRSQKRITEGLPRKQFSLDPKLAAIEKAHELETKVKFINQIQLGRYEIDTWYYSPYPDPYGTAKKIFCCEFCLKYTDSVKAYVGHAKICPQKQPPGREIYRRGSIGFWEVDGASHKVYCQNLCLLSKLFLDHKSVFYEVEPFLFYILCEVDDTGAHFVGYFSKEKNSSEGNNVACILTLPPHQRKGYGKLLISLSYELSKLEGVPGTPEKPLSDLGQLTYRSYWSWILLDLLRRQPSNVTVTIKELSKKTSIAERDIISTLQKLNITRYLKGQKLICTTPKMIEARFKEGKFRKPKLLVVCEDLHWIPPPKTKSSRKTMK